MYDPMCERSAGCEEKPVAPQGAPSESSSTESPTSTFSTMSAAILAEHCIRENGKYRKGEPSDDRYGLELFRRAILQHDEDAWDWLQHCYSEFVLSWIRRHPRRELAYGFDSEKNYIAQAFARFWFATAHNQKLEFNTLSAALQYLRMCLNGAIIDTLRAYSRPAEMPLPEPGSSEEEPFVEDTIDSDELWEQLQSMFPDEREQRLIYLLYHCGLKPREIISHCPREFSDVREIYRLHRNIIERLMRNADQLRWQLG